MAGLCTLCRADEAMAHHAECFTCSSTPQRDRELRTFDLVRLSVVYSQAVTEALHAHPNSPAHQVAVSAGAELLRRRVDPRRVAR